jgi:exodeoxyribonuclease (lambda-induced)
MWITGRAWCDFIMYVPDLVSVGNDLYVKRIYRDDEFIDSMVDQLMKFRSTVQQRESLFRRPFSSNADQIKVAA